MNHLLSVNGVLFFGRQLKLGNIHAKDSQELLCGLVFCLFLTAGRPNAIILSKCHLVSEGGLVGFALRLKELVVGSLSAFAQELMQKGHFRFALANDGGCFLGKDI